jgi:hypothetical protein
VPNRKLVDESFTFELNTKLTHERQFTLSRRASNEKKNKKKNRWQYSEELYDVGLKRAIS